MPKGEVGFVVTDDYKIWVEDLKNRIKQSRIKALLDEAFIELGKRNNT